ncbi:FAD/NAD(P)-binding domain-containing protein [Mycena galopus ATCC 62051]|nr:FAD/NAD(P)-binding domain-containing protein [Mycena galopus ATCC 62051]
MSTGDSTDLSILRVSIVGAGIAGLAAALALRRNGHRVHIFEASEIKTEIGAALGVPLNALRVLDHLGISRDNLKGVPFSGVRFNIWPDPSYSKVKKVVNIDAESGENKTIKLPAGSMIGLLCHRSDLYEELKRLATEDGEGLPVDLRLGTKVLACDPEKGEISLANGERVQADLILGADGVHSVIRTHIIGEVQNPSPVGVTCFRTVFEFHEKPDLLWLTEEVSGSRSCLAKDGPFRMLLMYPCRNGTLLNFVGFYADSPDAEGWTPKASREDIITKFKGFHPKFLPVLDLPNHSEIFKWKLGVLPELPTWIRGRAAILGDAAHATLPFLAQGAAMAIEEAGTIGCLFPVGTKPQDVLGRLKAYQDIRKARGEYVRIESLEQLQNLMNGGPPVRYNILSPLLQYDAIKVARECYEERFSRVID